MFRKTLTVGIIFFFITPALAFDELDLEPCINGEVSHSVNFSTQQMEAQVNAYLKRQSDKGTPYYLFRVGSHLLSSVYAEREE